MVGSRVSLVSIGSLRLKGYISRSLITRWAMFPTEGLSEPHSGLVQTFNVLKVHEVLIILGLGIQQRGPRLRKFILTF